MSTIQIMDILIVVLGIYLVCVSAYMKRTGKVHSILLGKEEIKTCKDQKAYAGYMYPRMLIFAVLTVLDGIAGFACEWYKARWYFKIAYMLILLAGFLWLTDCLRKARERFC